MAWVKDSVNPNLYTTSIPINRKSFKVSMNLETGTQVITDSSGNIVSTTDKNKTTQGPGYAQNSSLYGSLSGTANTQSSQLIKDNATPQQKADLASTNSWKSSVGNSGQPSSGTGTSPSGESGSTSNQNSQNANEGLGLNSDEATSSIGRDVAGEGGGDLRYPLKNTYQGDYIQIEMRTYQKSGFQSEPGSLTVTRMEDRKHTPLRNIYLPIQSGIVDSISVDWGNGEINPITAQWASLAMGTILESGRSNPLEAGGKFINNFGAIADKLLGPNATPDMQKLVANYFTEKAVGTPGLLSRSIGGAINNNLELLFNGPTLRSFTFNFKLTPREPAEAKVIKEIIRVFKKGMSPALSKSGLFLSSPNVFKIKYIYTGKGDSTEDHPYLNKIKVAALRDFSVNYTPDGNYMTYDGGSMTQYDLSMTFGEIDPVYAQDYDEEQGSKGMGW